MLNKLNKNLLISFILKSFIKFVFVLGLQSVYDFLKILWLNFQNPEHNLNKLLKSGNLIKINKKI